MTFPIIINQGGRDNTPNCVTWGICTNAERNTSYVSSSCVLTGYNAPAPIVPCCIHYRVNGGAWTCTTGCICPGQCLQFCVQTPNCFSSSMVGCAFIGGLCCIHTFGACVRAIDSTPNAYTLCCFTCAATSTKYTGSVVLSGFDCTTVTSSNACICSPSSGWGTTVCICNGQTLGYCVTSFSSSNTTTIYCTIIGGAVTCGSVTTCSIPNNTSPHIYYTTGCRVSVTDQITGTCGYFTTSAALTGIASSGPVNVVHKGSTLQVHLMLNSDYVPENQNCCWCVCAICKTGATSWSASLTKCSQGSIGSDYDKWGWLQRDAIQRHPTTTGNMQLWHCGNFFFGRPDNIINRVWCTTCFTLQQKAAAVCAAWKKPPLIANAPQTSYMSNGTCYYGVTAVCHPSCSCWAKFVLLRSADGINWSAAEISNLSGTFCNTGEGLYLPGFGSLAFIGNCLIMTGSNYVHTGNPTSCCCFLFYNICNYNTTTPTGCGFCTTSGTGWAFNSDHCYFRQIAKGATFMAGDINASEVTKVYYCFTGSCMCYVCYNTSENTWGYSGNQTCDGGLSFQRGGACNLQFVIYPTPALCCYARPADMGGAFISYDCRGWQLRL